MAIITGAGKKSFCAGQDLIELGKRNAAAAAGGAGAKKGEDEEVLDLVRASAGHPPTGFAGISRRVGKKPIIAAVNGFALGGGFEIVLNWYGSFPCFLTSFASCLFLQSSVPPASPLLRALNLGNQPHLLYSHTILTSLLAT